MVFSKQIKFLILVFLANCFSAFGVVDLKKELEKRKNGIKKCQFLATSINNELDFFVWTKYNYELFKYARLGIQKTQKGTSEYNTYLNFLGNAYNNNGFKYDELNQLSKALIYYQKALAVHKVTADKFGCANTFSNIGVIHLNLADYAKASSELKKSILIQEQLKDWEGLGVSYGNMSIVSESIGQHSKARYYFKKSLQLKNKYGDIVSRALAYRNIGLSYFHERNFKKAIPFLKKASLLYLKKKKMNDYYLSEMNIAMANLYSGDKSSLQYCESIVRDIENEKLNIRDLAVAQSNLGLIYLHLGLYNKAIVPLEKAYVINRKIKLNKNISENCESLVKCYEAIGDFKSGLKFQKELAALVKIIKTE